MRAPLPFSDEDSSSDRTVSDDGSINEVVDDVYTSQHENTFLVNEIPQGTVGSENDVATSENYRNTLNTLSFFEYVIRLSALEMTEQKQHIEVNDEKINLFLKDDDPASAEPSTSTDASLNRLPFSVRTSPFQRRSTLVEGSPTKKKTFVSHGSSNDLASPSKGGSQKTPTSGTPMRFAALDQYSPPTTPFRRISDLKHQALTTTPQPTPPGYRQSTRSKSPSKEPLSSIENENDDLPSSLIKGKVNEK